MQRTRLRFAIIVNQAFTFYTDQFRGGLDQYFSAHDIDAVYFAVGSLNIKDPDSEAREAFFQFITPAEFDGVILISSALRNTSNIEHLTEKIESLTPLPLVTIGPPVIGEDHVIADDVAGMRALVEHFVQHHGYKDVAFVSGPLSNPEAQDRLSAYRAVLEEAEIAYDESRVYIGDFRQSSGMKAVECFFDERKIQPQAIICSNDFMAIGAWRALQTRGQSVPEDIALAGYDDLQFKRPVTHQFTTVHQPLHAQAMEAARRLHGLVTEGIKGNGTMLKPELMVRKTCGCIDPGYRRRGSGIVEGAAACEGLAQRIMGLEASGYTRDDINKVSSQWLSIVHESLRLKRPTFELENALKDIKAKLEESGASQLTLSLLSTLNSLLLEECGHIHVITNQNADMSMTNLRIALDRLQSEIMTSVDEGGYSGLYSNIATHCQSDVFYVARFKDGKNVLAGATSVYASHEKNWEPGPGSWIPSIQGIFTVNILNMGTNRLGYCLLRTGSNILESYEYVSFRLSSIYNEIALLKTIQDTNEKMAQEIRAKEESQRRLSEALALVEKLSVEDELTGLRNRRGFLAFAKQQAKLLERQGEPYFILFGDLDGLKGINDKYGHKEGDRAIRAAADVLRDTLRDTDIIARLGGDEFTALAVGAQPKDSEAIARRIHRNCDKSNEQLSKPWKLSMSMGFAYSISGTAMDIERMLELADTELYKEKQEKKARSRATPS